MRAQDWNEVTLLYTKPITLKLNTSVGATESLAFSNGISKKQIFKDVKTTPCHRKAGWGSCRPLASRFRTHHNPKGHKIMSDAEKISDFTNLPSPANSPESL